MKEFRTIDKTGWLRGPWDNEPDKVQFDHVGLDCLIVRGPSGALCGYVGVPPTHPAYEKQYDDVDVRCHGGLTFAAKCQPNDDEARGVCHSGGLTEHPWWLGFDCAHSNDLWPRYTKYCEPLFGDETYRDLGYVKRQVERLAEQLVAQA